MRRALVAIVCVALATSCKSPVVSKLASLVAFEGEIDMAIGMALPAAPTSTSTIKLEIKSDKTRTEIGGLGMISISDAGKKKTWVVDPSSRTYTELDLSAAKAAAAAASASAPKAKATVKKTGRTDVVAGYECDVYEIDDPSGLLSHTETCMASGVSMMAMGLTGPFSMLSAGGDDAWSDLMSHGFPLRVVLRDAKGALLAKMEATRIEKKTVPDSEFEVPAGYTKRPSL